MTEGGFVEITKTKSFWFCPKCKRRMVQTTLGSGPTDYCKHCNSYFKVVEDA